MWPVSDAFKDAVRHGLHQKWIVRADVTQFNETVEEDIGVIGGEVTCDATAAIRRRCVLNLAPSELLVPGVASDLLFPVGRELSVRAGFVLMDGTEELVPQGVFRVTKPRIVDSGFNFNLQVDGYDRSRAVSRARFTQPYVVAAGVNYALAIKQIIMRAFPWFDINADFVFMTTALVTSQMIFESSDDPWVVCQNMAQGMGAEVFFDPTGKPNLRPEPDPLSIPSQWDYAEGQEANVLEIGKDLDDEQAYNGVIVTGTNATLGIAPVRAEAWDTDPTSPTYYDPGAPEASLYGPVPFFMESITTQSQANDAATGNLRRVKGILEQVDLVATQNPAHEAGDVVLVKRDRMKVNDINVVDGFRLPLLFDQPMSIGTRKVRVGV
jgi:hypothetical protein